MANSFQINYLHSASAYELDNFKARIQKDKLRNVLISEYATNNNITEEQARTVYPPSGLNMFI